jgi:hypothetical protein
MTGLSCFRFETVLILAILSITMVGFVKSTTSGSPI